MSWKYEDLKISGVNPLHLMCECGHDGATHHVVYWPLGMTLDECEAYGWNETGGLKRTWTGWFFQKVVPYKNPWSKEMGTDASGVTHYERVSYPNRLRALLLHVFRRPWYVDHCHKFREGGTQ